jgi:excisionase family DNA binding protein
MVENREFSHMLTASDVARLINVHRNTVRRWCNMGLLRTYRISSRGDLRFQEQDVYDFLQQKLNIVAKE